MARLLIIQVIPIQRVGIVSRACRCLCAGCETGGHAVDVASLNFSWLQTKEAFDTGALPDALLPAQEAIGRANHLCIVCPLWHGTFPAVLKAFLEQVFRPGFAYVLGGRSWRRRLRGKSARIVVTMGMPVLVYRWYFGAHGLKGLERSILGFCGIGPIREPVRQHRDCERHEARRMARDDAAAGCAGALSAEEMTWSRHPTGWPRRRREGSHEPSSREEASMPEDPSIPLKDHELADDELAWMKAVYEDFEKSALPPPDGKRISTRRQRCGKCSARNSTGSRPMWTCPAPAHGGSARIAMGEGSPPCFCQEWNCIDTREAEPTSSPCMWSARRRGFRSARTNGPC